jgi:hypothetical protein
LQADFVGISLEIFVKTQHFTKEAGRPGKNLQFQMQFATKPLDFGSCILKSIFKMPKNTAKKLQSQSHFALPPIFHH